MIQIIVVFYGSSLSKGLKEKEKYLLRSATFQDFGQNVWPHCLYLATQVLRAYTTHFIHMCDGLSSSLCNCVILEGKNAKKPLPWSWKCFHHSKLCLNVQQKICIFEVELSLIHPNRKYFQSPHRLEYINK